jgi:hypothetical protein
MNGLINFSESLLLSNFKKDMFKDLVTDTRSQVSGRKDKQANIYDLQNISSSISYVVPRHSSSG